MPVDTPVAPSTKSLTWEQFQLGLRGLSQIPGREGVSKELGMLTDMAQAQNVDDETFQKHVTELIRTHSKEVGVSEENIPDLLKGAVSWRSQHYIQSPAHAEQHETPTPKGSSLADFLPKKETKSAGGVTTASDIVDKHLKTQVKGAVEKEFDQLLATTPQDKLPDAIEAFYHQHLSAAGVLGSQYSILLDQSRKLYGGKEEFDKHQDTLIKRANEDTTKLAQVHQIDYLAAAQGKTTEQKDELKRLSYQRDTELENIRTLQARARLGNSPDHIKQLKEVASSMFDQEWERRNEENAALYHIAQELRGYGSDRYDPRGSVIEEFGSSLATVTASQQLYNRDQWTTAVSQGPTFRQNDSGNGSGAIRHLGNRARNFVRNIRNNLKKKAEKLAQEVGEQVVQKGFFAAIGPEGVLAIIIAIVVIIIFILIVVVIMSILGGNNSNQQSQGTPIPGLTLNTTYPQAVANGQNIPYTIDVTYTGTDSITISDNIPATAVEVPHSVNGTAQENPGLVTWVLDKNNPLSDSTSSSKHYQFKITLQPTQQDVQIKNIITATYTYGAPGQTGGGNPPSAGGYCTPSYLAPYFGSVQNGQVASCICKYESGGDPSAENKACLVGGTADYSIGLFQINLLAHCSSAFIKRGNYCSVSNAQQVASCTQSMMNPINNIKEAVAIYHGSGNSWNVGWAAERGKCF